MAICTMICIKERAYGEAPSQINRRSNLYNVSVSAVTTYLLSEFQNHSFNSSCIRWWLISCFKCAYSNSSVHVYRRKIPIVILLYDVIMLIKYHKKSNIRHPKCHGHINHLFTRNTHLPVFTHCDYPVKICINCT